MLVPSLLVKVAWAVEAAPIRQACTGQSAAVPTTLPFSSHDSSTSIAISLTPGPCGLLSLWPPLYHFKLLGKYHQGCLWKVEWIKCEYRPTFSDGQTINMKKEPRWIGLADFFYASDLCQALSDHCRVTVSFVIQASRLLSMKGNVIRYLLWWVNKCKPGLS